MIKSISSNLIFSRVKYFNYLRSFAVMSANAESDNEVKLSKRAIKRLCRKRLLEEAKLDENEKQLAKQRKRQKKDEKNALKGEEELIQSTFLAETEYYFENGLRKVFPYYYNFTAYAKGRWFGIPLVEVFAKEFQNYTIESCTRAVEAGTIQVNGKPAAVDHVIKNGDLILNRIHRHELPVTACPPTILINNEEYLVVDKPASIPIHPCGRYRHNSLIYILAKEHGFSNLRTIHRLDRLTSGLVIFCKTEAKTREMMRSIAKRNVEKEYLCRVTGEFPSGVIDCDQPITALSHKYGIYKTDASGKPSKTTFERIGFSGGISTIRCKPVTGRTHQIRVHLQYLGFPIINDPLYGGPVWGPDGGKGGEFGRSDEELIKDLTKLHNSSVYLDTNEYSVDNEMKLQPFQDLESDNSSVSDSSKCLDKLNMLNSSEQNNEEDPEIKRFKSDPVSMVPDTSTSMVPDSSTQTPNLFEKDALAESEDTTVKELDPAKSLIDENCRECKLKYLDPKSEDLVMYLHAFRYKGPGWEFSTMLPEWATDIEIPKE